MITTELEKLCTLLRGYEDSDYYDVKYASKKSDGRWMLEVVHVVNGKEEGPVNEDQKPCLA